MICEICQSNKATHMCDECRQNLCEGCMLDDIDVCIDCDNERKGMEHA
jgi:hypothetical protein